MNDALQTSNLPPEAIQLIKEGTPKPQTPVPVLELVEKPKVEKPKVIKEKPEEPVALVSMNFRLPANLPQALLKVSSERKLKKIKPFTQQDIVAEAISDWLKKNEVK